MWMFHVDVDGGVREHIMRGEHTLCGIPRERYEWRDTTGAACAVECRDCMAVPVGHATSNDMVELGMTYRQLNYWVQIGLLAPDPRRAETSGHRFTFRPAEYRAAQLIVALAAAGISPPVAGRAARNGGWLDDRVRVDLKLGTSA